MPPIEPSKCQLKEGLQMSGGTLLEQNREDSRQEREDGEEEERRVEKKR